MAETNRVTVATLTQQSPTSQKALFEWRAHPARERPVSALMAALAILSMAICCGVLGRLGWGLLAVVVLVLSLGRFLFPSRFVIDQEGVTVMYFLVTQRCRWTEVRRFSCDRRGLYLSRRSRRSRLDAYRGIHLLFGASREDVIRQVRLRLAARKGTEGGRTVGREETQETQGKRRKQERGHAKK